MAPSDSNLSPQSRLPSGFCGLRGLDNRVYFFRLRRHLRTKPHKHTATSPTCICCTAAANDNLSRRATANGFHENNNGIHFQLVVPSNTSSPRKQVHPHRSVPFQLVRPLKLTLETVQLTHKPPVQFNVTLIVASASSQRIPSNTSSPREQVHPHRGPPFQLALHPAINKSNGLFTGRSGSNNTCV